MLTYDAPGVLDLPGAELTAEHPGEDLAAPVVLPVLRPECQSVFKPRHAIGNYECSRSEIIN